MLHFDGLDAKGVWHTLIPMLQAPEYYEYAACGEYIRPGGIKLLGDKICPKCLKLARHAKS